MKGGEGKTPTKSKPKAAATRKRKRQEGTKERDITTGDVKALSLVKGDKKALARRRVSGQHIVV